MEGNTNPMSHLPQFLGALLARIEAALAEQQSIDPARRAATEALLRQLRKQADAMRAVAAAATGEGLTPEQAASITAVPVPQPSLFPAWANGKEK
jgi:hypothetical protein